MFHVKHLRRISLKDTLIKDTLIKSAKLRGLRGARWQGMTKQHGRPHVMRNDTASVLLVASRRALHVLGAPNPQCFPLILMMES